MSEKLSESSGRDLSAACDIDLFDALDLPPYARSLQTLYWEAKREWEKLEASYKTVLEDMLKRTGRL